MKYLTKRQRKRRVGSINRFGKVCYKNDSDADSEAEADNSGTTATNKKLPTTTTKTIVKDAYKSKYNNQQGTQSSQSSQPQQPAVTDGTNYRRLPFGFGTCTMPSWFDRQEQERHHHHAEPLTLGSFLDIGLITHLFGERHLRRLAAAASAENVVGNELASAPQPQGRPIMSWSQDVSVHEMLAHLALTTPYKELADLTLSLLQNTAFGPLNTGSRNTSGNVPYMKYWPNPYQLCYRNGNEPQTAQLTEIMPEESAVKPIGYETKGKSPVQQPQEPQKQQAQLQPIMKGSKIQPLDIFDFGLFQQGNIDPNPNSIVDSIKCICKRHIQWDNWQQSQRFQRKDPAWERRSRTVMNNSRIVGQFIVAPMPELPLQMMTPSAATNNTVRNNNNNNNNLRNLYKNNNNNNNNRMIIHQQQQQMQQQQMQHSQQYLQQQQQLRFNYQQQQQQQQQPMQQHNFWPSKHRQQHHMNRYHKGKQCKHCFCNILNNPNHHNHNHNTCGDIDPFLLNLSQKDLDAAQMYAIYGERFFDMPMGSRYKSTLQPMPMPTPTTSTSAAAGGATATVTATVTNPMPQPMAAACNWQPVAPTFMAQHPMPGGVVTTTAPMVAAPMQLGAPLTMQSAPVMAPVYVGSNLYAANFPPLPAPNPRRDHDQY